MDVRLVAITCASLLACSALYDHYAVASPPPLPPITGGTADPDDPGVAYIYIVKTSPLTAYGCSGVVVSPHVVLTAGHCVSSDVIGDGFEFTVFLGNDAYDVSQQEKPGYLLEAKKTILHPDFQYFPGQPPPNDIAAVVTPAPMFVKPWPMNLTPMDDSWIDKSLRLAGFGRTTCSDSKSAGVRYTVNTTLATYDDASIGGGGPTAGPCEGDSGGPWFMSIGGVETLIGVGSFVFFTGQSTAMRVDAFADFVLPTIDAEDPGFLVSADAGPADASGEERDGSEAGVPEAASFDSSPEPALEAATPEASEPSIPDTYVPDSPPDAPPAVSAPDQASNADSGGCSCMTLPAKTPGGWAVALLIALVTMRRKR